MSNAEKVLFTFGFKLCREFGKWDGHLSDERFQNKNTFVIVFRDSEKYPFGIYERDTEWVIQPCNWERLMLYLCEDMERINRTLPSSQAESLVSTDTKLDLSRSKMREIPLNEKDR